jgi:hypothetical protein
MKNLIKNTLKDWKEGAGIASDYVYKQYKSTKSAIKSFLSGPTAYDRRMNKRALEKRKQIDKGRKERGLKPIKW